MAYLITARLAPAPYGQRGNEPPASAKPLQLLRHSTTYRGRCLRTPCMAKERRKTCQPGKSPGWIFRSCADRRPRADTGTGPGPWLLLQTCRGRMRQPVPITGAGLDPSGAPGGIPSTGSDGKGCWGEETAGAHADIGVDVARMVAVPEGGATVVRIVDPGAAAQQLGDPPSPPPYPVRKGGRRRGEQQDRWGDVKNIFLGACGARVSTANFQPIFTD